MLVIGDSISEGYTPSLAKALRDVASVAHVGENARSSSHTLARLETYLATTPKPFLIVWNNGLHDISSEDTPGRPRTTPEAYETNLHAIGTRLLGSGANVVFLTTTEVPDGAANRLNSERQRYNGIAQRVMENLRIDALDLGAYSETIHSDHTAVGNVHFTTAGSRKLAEFLASALRAKLTPKATAARAHLKNELVTLSGTASSRMVQSSSPHALLGNPDPSIPTVDPHSSASGGGFACLARNELRGGTRRPWPA